MDQFFERLSFPTPTIGVVDMCFPESIEGMYHIPNTFSESQHEVSTAICMVMNYLILSVSHMPTSYR